VHVKQKNFNNDTWSVSIIHLWKVQLGCDVRD